MRVDEEAGCAAVDGGPSGGASGGTPASGGVGDAAAARGVALHELTTVKASLEEAFMELTANAVEYQALAKGGDTPLVVPEPTSRAREEVSR